MNALSLFGDESAHSAVRIPDIISAPVGSRVARGFCINAVRAGLYEGTRARISKDRLKEAGRFRPIASTRRRIPTAAFRLKKYFAGTGPVLMHGNNVDSLARLGDSEVLAVKHSPRHTIPEFVHCLEYDGEVSSSVASEKTVDIFEDNNLWAARPNKRGKIVEEARLSSPKAVTRSHSSKGKVLARESGRPNVRVGDVPWVNTLDVLLNRNLRPVRQKNPAAERLFLTEVDRCQTGSLEPQIEAADARKKRDVIDWPRIAHRSLESFPPALAMGAIVPHVDVHWRPSGGRGEYEHVPQDVLLNRRIIVNSISVPGAHVTTDAWGRMRDGKPRLRRENPNDRSLLNIHSLVAALALLPHPIREDHGRVLLPLRDGAYVVRTIGFSADHAGAESAVCTPQHLQILHDSNVIDLAERLTRIAALLNQGGLGEQFDDLAGQYRTIVGSGRPHAELRGVADALIGWLRGHPEMNAALEAPSNEFVDQPEAGTSDTIDLSELTADETQRRLVSHYKIDRSLKLRRAKVVAFTEEHGHIFCENCTFSFESRYGERGKGFIEVHHTQPLAALLPNTITRLSDLLLLCSNCHRIVHRRAPMLTPPALAAITVYGDGPGLQKI